MPRPRNKRPTSVEIFLGADGYWHGHKVVGVKGDGSPDRRHRQGKSCPQCNPPGSTPPPAAGCECREKVADKIRALEDQIASGNVLRAGRTPTFAEWLDTWLATIVIDLDYKTQETYGWAVRNHLKPRLGRHKMDAIPDGKVSAMYRGLADKEDGKLAPASVHSVFRTGRNAVNEYIRRHQPGMVNPFEVAKSPKYEEPEITPLFAEEVQRILEVCATRRNGTRFSIGLPMGWRQGEALGMQWWTETDSTQDEPFGLDPDSGFVRTALKAQRRKWRHGCDDPVRCARWGHGCLVPALCGQSTWECPQRRVKCRTTPCQPPWLHGCPKPAACRVQAWRCPQRKVGVCKRHTRSCPDPCPENCAGHARSCPQRKDGGIVFSDPKSSAGKRRQAIPEAGRQLILVHRAIQSKEREDAGELWEDHNLVWCTPLGRPIDHRADWEEWKLILRLAGVRDARTHDGRHWAATMLLLLGVDPREVMDFMGWASARMLKRYQHVIDEMRKRTAKKIGDMLWPGSSPPPEPSAGPLVGDSATDHATSNVIPFRRRGAGEGSTAGQGA